METLGAHSDDSQIDGETIARAHFADKVGVVLQIHRARSTAPVGCIAESDGRIECVSRVIEHGHDIPDVHMPVAVRPFGLRDGFVAGWSQLLNLITGEIRRLHRSILSERRLSACRRESI